MMQAYITKSTIFVKFPHESVDAVVLFATIVSSEKLWQFLIHKAVE